MSRIRTIAALLLALLASPAARAQVESQLGLGSRATAMGGAFTAVADDLSAVHYNPAGLALRTPRDDGPRYGIDLHVGFLYAHPDLWLKGARVDGERLVFDQPLAPYRGNGHQVTDTYGLTLGIRVDLNQALGFSDEHVTVALGLALYLPLESAFRWSILPGHELQWPMYLDRTQRIGIYPALALKVHGMVSIGIGLRTSLDTETNTEAVVVTEEGADGLGGQLGEEVRIAGKVAPTFALLFEPNHWFRLGLVLRLELAADDWGYNDVDANRIPGMPLGAFGYTHRFAHYYQPLEFAFGVAVHPLPELLLSLDGVWAGWSGYLDSNRDNYAGVVEGGIFRDTFTPRVGASVEVHPSTELMAGYVYEQTPFVNRGSWTNFVDNDKHVLSLGTRTDVMRAAGSACLPVFLSWHVQLQLLRDRREVKDWRAFASEAEATANPGWPGWLSGGWLVNVGISLDAEF